MGGVRERTKQGTETDQCWGRFVLALNSSKLCQPSPPPKTLLQMVPSVDKRNKKLPNHHLLLKVSRGGTWLTQAQSTECDRPKLRCPFCCVAGAGVIFKTPLM